MAEAKAKKEKTAEKETVPIETQLSDLVTLQKYSRQTAKKELFYNLMSPQVNELVGALAKFKQEMPELKTDKTAAGRYKYQSLPTLLNAISPVLAKYGCVCMQPVQSIGEQVYVITMVLHSSGQYIRSITSIPEQYHMAGKLVNTKEHLQARGGAITYTKRHALKSILGIDADEDTDGGAAQQQQYQRQGYGNQ